MKSTKDLYGDLPIWVIEKQKEISAIKINYAKEKIKELQKVPLMDRDDMLINKILNAIKFNNDLIDEEI